MKKIILLILILNSFVFSDIFSDLKKEKASTFRYLNKEYPLDDTCSRMDLKKFLLINENMLKGIKSKKFYLELCDPFYKLYKLNKKFYSKKYSVNILFKKYEELRTDYPDSFYINFYKFVFEEKSHFVPTISFSIFKTLNDDFSKYVNIYTHRIVTDTRTGKTEPFLKTVYREGKPLLNSKFDIIYLSVSDDLSKYILKEKKDEALDFLLYRIEENRKRGLDTKYLYMDLANLKFNETYLNDDFDSELIKDLILKSYSYGELPSQTKLYLKLKIRKEYLDIKKNYPKNINNVNEYELIMDNLAKTKKYAKVVSKDYYYLALLNAFLYEKLIYLKKTEENKTLLIRNMRRVLKTEPNIKIKRRIEDKIEELKKNKFLKLK